MTELTSTRIEPRYSLIDMTEIEVCLLSELIDSAMIMFTLPEEVQKAIASLQEALDQVCDYDEGYLNRESWVHEVVMEGERDECDLP